MLTLYICQQAKQHDKLLLQCWISESSVWFPAVCTVPLICQCTSHPISPLLPAHMAQLIFPVASIVSGVGVAFEPSASGNQHPFEKGGSIWAFICECLLYREASVPYRFCHKQILIVQWSSGNSTPTAHLARPLELQARPYHPHNWWECYFHTPTQNYLLIK